MTIDKLYIPHIEEVMLLSDLENIQESEELAQALKYMREHQVVEAYRPLAGRGFRVFIKKVLRKMLRFYVEPITKDMTDYNVHCVRAVEQLIQAINDKDKELKCQKLETDKD